MHDSRWISSIRAFSVVALAVLLSVLAAGESRAQESSASLHGRVIDAEGRGLAGVAVTAQSADLIRTITTRTGASGHYQFAALPAGNYIVGFAHAGLVPVKYTLRLVAGEAGITNVTMRPQERTEDAITVSVDRPWPPPSWAVSLASSHAALDQLPVTGTSRSVIGLVTDLPGIRPDTAAFFFDGLPLQHGWRVGSTPSFAGPGPETIQEATVIPGRLAADYGRLQQGAILTVTRAGSDRLTGAIRASLEPADLNADILRSARDTSKSGSTLEYALGGPVVPRRVWFFASGRNLDQSVADRTAFTDAPFNTETRERFGLAKLTVALSSQHRLEGQWVGARQRLIDALPLDASRIGDERALDRRVLSDRAISGAYFGHLGLDISARYTRETGKVAAEGTPGLPNPGALSVRTPLIDQQTGVRWWATGSCALCEPQQTTSTTARLTLGRRLGAHYISAGYDRAIDRFEPRGQPQGGSFTVLATRTRMDNGVLTPVFLPTGSTWISWAPVSNAGVRLQSDAAYIGDRWAAADGLQFDFGVRLDRYRGTTQPAGVAIVSEQVVSPRIFATWRPSERLPWTFAAGFARYADAGVDRSLDLSLATSPQERLFLYGGPAVNATGTAIPSGEALDRLFDWFQSQGGTARAPAFAIEPGVSTVATKTIAGPRVDEWSLGVSRPLGTQGSARADLTFRQYANLPARQIVLSSPVTDSFGRSIDAARVVASDQFERDYTGVTFQAKYRFGHYADVDAQYTMSHLSGNTGALNSGAFGGTELAYPEYFDADWRLPTGYLPDDARHRFRLWAHSEIIADEKRGILMVTLVHSRESGHPYGAMGLVNIQPYVANPGYQQPPVAVGYYFTAPDAFRTEPLSRTDLGLTYRRRLPGTVRGDLFGTLHVLNVFNTVRVLNPQLLTVTRTAFTDSSLQPFNPFTQSPIENVNWTFDDANTRLGSARESLATTLGRAVRLTIGIRF